MLVISGFLLSLSLVARRQASRAAASTHVLMGRMTVLCLLLVPVGLALRPSFPILEFDHRTSSLRDHWEAGLDDEKGGQARAVNAVIKGDPHGLSTEVPDDVTKKREGTAELFGPPGRGSRESAVLATNPVVKDAARLSLPWWSGVLVVGWAVVAAVLLLRLLHSHLRVWKLGNQSSRELGSVVQKTLESCLPTGANNFCPQVRRSENVNVPICIGLFRRKILLPVDVERWSQDKLRCCIDHELVHAQRHDVIWSTMTDILACVHWPNPLIGVFRRSFKQDVESACDDGVLDRGNDSTTYAETLVAMARKFSRDRSFRVAAMPIADHAGFRKRVERIMETGRDRRPPSRLLIAAIATLGFAFTILTLAIRPQLVVADGPSGPPNPTRSAIQGPLTDDPADTGEQVMQVGMVSMSAIRWVSDAEQMRAIGVEEADVVLAFDPTSAELLAKHFEKHRPQNRPRLLTIGLTTNVLQRLERAQLDATISRQPYEIGYRSVEMLVRSHLELLPPHHPPRLIIPSRVVFSDTAGFLAGELRDGRRLTFDNRLANCGLAIRLQIPQFRQSEHNDWWSLVSAGAGEAAEQFGASMDVVSAPQGDQLANEVLAFRDDQAVLSFPLADGGKIIALSWVPDQPSDSVFVLKTSTQRIATDTARSIANVGDGPIRLSIIAHAQLKQSAAESFLPILTKALRDL